MQYVSTLFDLSANLNTSIPVHVWQRAARGLFTILDRLEANPHIVLDETLETTPERSEEPPAGEPFKIAGNLRAFVERLDDEFFKILQVPPSMLRPYRVARARASAIASDADVGATGRAACRKQPCSDQLAQAQGFKEC